MIVDLRSDTVTQPTQEMRRAMAAAVVGDDGFSDDPTILRLQDQAAELLGKEAGLFLPGGTMANLCAVLTHTSRGDEVIVEANSHTQIYERGGWAVYGGLLSRQVAGRCGALDPAEVESLIRPQGDAHLAGTSLVCMENTHMLAGGIPISVDQTAALARAVHRQGVPVHLDGARLFNASVAQNVSARELVAPVDSAMFCLSKGLCCPAGSLLVGSREFIERARCVRQSLGGTMRQVGILAAAGLVALDTMIDRLAEDHANARRLAEGLAHIGHGLSVDLARVRTNIIYVSTAGVTRGTDWFVNRLAEAGIRILALGPDVVRMVTHHDVDGAQIDYALTHIAAILRGV